MVEWQDPKYKHFATLYCLIDACISISKIWGD